jgi:hypothetical protein
MKLCFRLCLNEQLDAAAMPKYALAQVKSAAVLGSLAC